MQNGKTAGNDWLQRLLDEHESALLRYVATLTHNAETARDVVQDAFIRLVRQPDPRAIACPGAWLYRVCRNRAIELLRHQRRVDMPGDEAIDRLPSHEPDPAAAAGGEEEAARVLELVAALPENLREVVRLRFQAGLSYREIAEVSHLSVSNVGFLLHTAIRRLRAEVRRGDGPALPEDTP